MNEEFAKLLFKVVPTDETRKSFGIICYKSRATEVTFETEEEAWKYLENPTWDVILTLISSVMEYGEEQKKLTKKE